MYAGMYTCMSMLACLCVCVCVFVCLCLFVLQYSREGGPAGDVTTLPEIVDVILLSPEPTPFRPRKRNTRAIKVLNVEAAEATCKIY